MPIEVMADRGIETLRFGPLSPKGLTNPHSEERPYAVVQLRQDNLAGTAYNMVGFQNKMAYPEQKRIFRTIPGLEEAEFLKLGSMHRNLYIHSPKMLTPNLASRHDPDLYFAGQITGVEGYFESTCIGLLVALFIHQRLNKLEFSTPPRSSAMGSLLTAITEDKEHFQPTNINFGLLPDPPSKIKQQGKNRREAKRDQQIQEAKHSFADWVHVLKQ
jgi:methylenetetrahydrofolate--tRNA-(uracil-5-)-methyltransferase